MVFLAWPFQIWWEHPRNAAKAIPAPAQKQGDQTWQEALFPRARNYHAAAAGRFTKLRPIIPNIVDALIHAPGFHLL
jgi:hypothetical protein